MTKNTIKYSSQIKPDFVIELRELVNEYFEKNKLSKYGNANMIMKSVFMVSLYFIPYILMLTGVIDSFSGILLCWIVMGIGMSGVGMALMHDANHGTYSKNQKINQWLGYSLYLLGGFPPTWKYQHNTLHHGFTNIDGHDEDIEPIGLLRFSPHKPLIRFHKFQHWYAWFFYGLMTLSWVTVKDFSKLSEYNKNNAPLGNHTSYSQLLFTLIGSKILYYLIFLAIPLIVLPVSWHWIVVFFLAMHFVSGLLLSTIFQTAHVVSTSAYPLPDVNGNIENNWAIHQLSTTTDFSPDNKLLTWLIGGLNYQVEHHLFPNICHVHYKNISAIVRNTANKYELPYHVQPGFIRAVMNHVKMLKLLGKQPPVQNNLTVKAENIPVF
jgi:linoleoyl-CoA desaturase